MARMPRWLGMALFGVSWVAVMLAVVRYIGSEDRTSVRVDGAICRTKQVELMWMPMYQPNGTIGLQLMPFDECVQWSKP